MIPVLIVLLASHLASQPGTSICIAVPSFPWATDQPSAVVAVPAAQMADVIGGLEHVREYARMRPQPSGGARAQLAIAKGVPHQPADSLHGPVPTEVWTEVLILPWHAGADDCRDTPWRSPRTWAPVGDTVLVRAYARPEEQSVDGRRVLDVLVADWELGPAGYFHWNRRDTLVGPDPLTVAEYARYYAAIPTRDEWDEDPERAYRELEELTYEWDPEVRRYPLQHVLHWAWADLRNVQAVATVRGVPWPKVPDGADSLLNEGRIYRDFVLPWRGQDSVVRRWMTEHPCPEKHAPFPTASEEGPLEAACAIALAGLSATANDPGMVQTAVSIAVRNAEPVRGEDWWAIEIDLGADERLLVILLHEHTGRAEQFSLARPRFYGSK